MQTEGGTYMGSSFPKPLTEKEEQYYVQQMENMDPEAKNILIERNLRLVAHIAKKYTGSAWTQDDLISIGTIGLIKAVNTYTSKKSTRLATYAARCIENEILMSIRASRKNRMEISLNLPIGTDQDGNEISFNDILGTDDDEILDAVSLKIQVSKLYRALEQNLSPRERQVLFQRYGLGGEEPVPQREIAAKLGISRSYVSRIEKKALEKLKFSLKDS
ncbi:MAG: RNA polymerase sporulation sigma factor SigK [Firmicutes bacterium]|nr:RNA polymerase sporulation sigma factor SigK [Bacillota bacterium]